MLNASWIVIVTLPVAIEVTPPPIPFGPDDSWSPPSTQTLFAHEGVERRVRSASQLAQDHHLFRSVRVTPPPDRPSLPVPTVSIRVATDGSAVKLR